MQLIRRPRGSSTAAPFTKPSTKWLMVVPNGSAVQVFIGQDARHQCERSPIGNEGERSPDYVDLAHPLELDRIRPLLIGALFESPEGHVSRSIGPGIEGANPTEERLQTLGIGNVRLVVAGLAADTDDLVSLLLQCFPYGGSDSFASNDEFFYLVSPVRF